MTILRRLVDFFIRRVSRDTSSGRLIKEIDGLRFIAIISVVLFHLSGHVAQKSGTVRELDALANFLSYGSFGVQLFFVISGFVISFPFAGVYLVGQKTPNLREYYIRRLTRLEPPYIVNLLILFILTIMFTERTFSDLLPHLFASLFYVHNVIYAEYSLVNIVAWSLEIELQFYVLTPLLTKLFLIRSEFQRRSMLILIILASSFVSQYLHDFPRYKLSFLSQLHYFATGFLLTDIYLTNWRDKLLEKTLAWDLISIVSWFTMGALLSSGKPYFKALLPFTILAAYSGAFRSRYLNKFFSLPVIYTTGGMCYSIYLYHFTVISATGRLSMNLFSEGLPFWSNIVIQSFLILPPVMLVCTTFFICFEKPFMQKYWHTAFLSRLKNVLQMRPEVTETPIGKNHHE